MVSTIAPLLAGGYREVRLLVVCRESLIANQRMEGQGKRGGEGADRQDKGTIKARWNTALL